MVFPICQSGVQTPGTVDPIINLCQVTLYSPVPVVSLKKAVLKNINMPFAPVDAIKQHAALIPG